MANNRVKIHFQENTLELTSMFLSGGEIVDFMGKPNELCKDLDDKIIEVNELLGKGVEGSVYSIVIKNNPNDHKKYVIKDSLVAQSETHDISKNLVGKITFDQYFIKFVKPDYSSTSKSVYIFLNGGDGKKLIGNKVVVPTYLSICKTSENKKYINLATKTEFLVPKGSYACKVGAYSEYIISLLTSDLYKTQKSINFIDVFGFATCEKSNNEYHQFIFMEKITLPLDSALAKNLIDEESMMSILIQTSFAIEVLQSSFQINHNDLHHGNVFLEEITPETMYNNKYINKFTHFQYNYNSSTVVFPRGKYIVKLGDYGFSVKWSSPIVANLRSLSDGYNGMNPNFYSTKFDLATLIYTIKAHLETLKRPSEIITSLQKFILNGKNVRYMYNRDSGVYRPTLTHLPSFLSKPGDILEFLSEQLLEKSPPKSKVLNIGNIGKDDIDELLGGIKSLRI